MLSIKGSEGEVGERRWKVMMVGNESNEMASVRRGGSARIIVGSALAEDRLLGGTL